MGTDVTGVLSSIANRADKNLRINDGDFQQDGLWYCGKCGEKKQTYIELAGMKRIVSCTCKCDVERIQAEKEAQQKEDLMKKVEELKSISLMDRKFRNATFDSFEVKHTNERNYKLCRHYAENFDNMLEKSQCLLFYGDTGTGKSWAAACIANYLLAKGVPVIMTSIISIMNMIQDGDVSELELMRRINKAKLVIFDDLGTERKTDYGLEKAYSIIDSRYRRELPTIFTTNLTVNEMLEETDTRYKRIYSRVFENVYPMQFTGADWRKQKAGQQFEKMKQFEASGFGSKEDSKNG